MNEIAPSPKTGILRRPLGGRSGGSGGHRRGEDQYRRPPPAHENSPGSVAGV